MAIMRITILIIAIVAQCLAVAAKKLKNGGRDEYLAHRIKNL
jgi:hypothetical protein